MSKNWKKVKTSLEKQYEIWDKKLKDSGFNDIEKLSTTLSSGIGKDYDGEGVFLVDSYGKQLSKKTAHIWDPHKRNTLRNRIYNLEANVIGHFDDCLREYYFSENLINDLKEMGFNYTKKVKSYFNNKKLLNRDIRLAKEAKEVYALLLSGMSIEKIVKLFKERKRFSTQQLIFYYHQNIIYNVIKKYNLKDATSYNYFHRTKPLNFMNNCNKCDAYYSTYEDHATEDFCPKCSGIKKR